MKPPPETFWTLKTEILPSQNFIIEAKNNDSGKEWKVYESFYNAGGVSWFKMRPISGNITLTCTFVESEISRSLTYNYDTGYRESDQHLNYYLSPEQIQNFSELDETKINSYKCSKSVSLAVIQNYDWFKNFELPFEEIAKRLLEYTGLDIDSTNRTSSDLQIIVNVNGTSEKETVFMQEPGTKLSKNVEVRPEIGFNGTIIFKSASKAYYATDFNWTRKFYPIEYVAKSPYTWVQNVNQLTSGYRFMFYRESFLKSFGEMLINAFELDPVDFYLYTSTDDNAAISSHALKLLGELHDTSAYDHLINIYKNDSAISMRRAAIYALGEMQDIRAFDIVIEAFNEKDLEIRINAGITLFNTLVKMQDPKAFDIMTEALSETYPNIRLLAAIGLGNLNDQRAVKPLIHALDDKNYRVVENAVYALGKLGDKRAVEPLINHINKAQNNTNLENWKRMIFINAIIQVLGDLGDLGAIEYIIPLLKSNKLKTNAQEALIQLTGENMGDKYKDWIKWWNEHKSEYIHK